MSDHERKNADPFYTPQGHDPLLLLGRIAGIIEGIPGRLDRIETNQSTLAAAQNTRIADCEKDISKVKQKQMWFSGLSSAMGLIVGALFGHYLPPTH